MSRVRLTQHKPRSVNRQKNMNELKTVASSLSVQLTKIDSFNLPLDCKLFANLPVWNGHLELHILKKLPTMTKKQWIYQRTSPLMS